MLTEEDINETTIEKLKARELEIEVLVAAIEQNLEENGYKVTNKVYSGSMQNGIRIHGKLSFRGCDKAEEYYNVLDEKKEDYLNFLDFRAMYSLRSPNGFVHHPQFARWESWQMYMADQDIELTNANISLNNFIKYRKNIENTTPIANELKTVGLGYLPKVQSQWILVKKNIRDSFFFRSEEKKLKEEEHLNLEEVSYILCNSGLCYSKYEFKRAMCVQVRFKNVITELLSKNLKRNLRMRLPDDTDLFRGGIILRPKFVFDGQDLCSIKPSHLIAWIFSNKTLPSTGILYQWLLKTKYATIRGIRNFYWGCGELWELGNHLRERMIFKQKNIKGVGEANMQDRTTFRVNFEIGEDIPSSDDGTNVYWKLSPIENPSDFFVKLSLPKDCGCGVIIEFATNNSVSEERIKDLCIGLKLLILDHLGEEFNRSQQFRSIFIFPSKNVVDSTPVIRLAITFRRHISVDSFLEMMHLPYRLNEIVSHFSGEISSNMNIIEMFDKTSIPLDNFFRLTGTIFCEYNKEMFTSFLETTRIAFSSGLTFDAVFNKLRPKPGSEVVSADKWDHIRDYFPKIVKLCDNILNKVSTIRGTTLGFSFRTLYDLVEKISLLSPWCKRYLPVELFKKAGALKAKKEQLSERLTTELMNIFNTLENYLEDKQDAKEAERLRVLRLSEKDRKAEEFNAAKKDIMLRLNKLGVESNERDLFDNKNKTPEQFAEDLYNDQMAADMNAFKIYEDIRSCILSFHSCDVVLGKSRIAVSIQGFDFMDLVPPPPSISTVIAHVAEREAISSKLDLEDSLFY